MEIAAVVQCFPLGAKNVTLPASVTWRNDPLTIILRPASPGDGWERVERKACYRPASASPFPCSLITCYLNHAISSAGLAAALPIRGHPWMRPEGPRRAAPRCWEPARCRQGWCGARIELGDDAFSSGTGTHCSATTAKLSIHHLATSFQMEKSVGTIALFLLKKEWDRAMCLKPTSRFLQSQKFWLDANFG